MTTLKISKLPICLILFTLFSLNREASAQSYHKICSQVLDPTAISANFNEEMANRYPKLKMIFKDPDAFVATMRERFRLQKQLTPHQPLLFDYSDVGLPLLADINKALERKIQFLSEIQRNQLYRGKSNISTDEIAVALQYLNDLHQEAQSAIQANAIRYLPLIELSYYASRAIGHFDAGEYSFAQRLYLQIDRNLDGYQQHSMADEYALYKERKFKLFHDKSASSGFQAAEGEFERVFADQDQLNIILVPTNEALDRDAFLRLMRYDIGLTGFTYDPIIADGFLRPSGDFLVHDLRHESAKYLEKIKYLQSHGLTHAQFSALGPAIDRWTIELNHETGEIKDPQLKEAVDLLVFNFYHDRGYPQVPSAFLNRKKDVVAFALYAMMKISGQGVPFRNPYRYLPQASEWLRNFWLARLDQEVDVVSKL